MNIMHLHEDGKSKFGKADCVSVNIQIFKYQLVKLVNDRVLHKRSIIYAVHIHCIIIKILSSMYFTYTVS